MTRLIQKKGDWWVEDDEGLRRASELEVSLWLETNQLLKTLRIANDLLEKVIRELNKRE